VSKTKLKTPSFADLKAKVAAIDNARADALSTIGDEFSRLYSSYFDRVRSMIASNQALSKTDALTLQNAKSMMGDLQQILTDSGLSSVVRRYGEQFPDLADVAASYYEPFGLDDSLAGVPKNFLVAWVDFSSNELVNTLDSTLLPPVRSALLQVNAGNMTRDDLISQITTLEPSVTTNDATVFVDDTFSQFQRSVVVQKGESVGLEIYQYLGPDDSITSPQCEAMLHVDKHGAQGILYKDEITPALHPNLEKYGRNPLIGGGHPRCRHQWSPITLDYAKGKGFKPRDDDEESDDDE
jgi:hypothetical protein